MSQPIVDTSTILISTDRLILRSFRAEDLADFYEYASVPGVGEMAGWRHHDTIETSGRILDGFIREKEVLAIVHKKTEKVIGTLGIHARSDEDCPLSTREIGYVLSKDYWGQGLMTEAVSEVIRFCFEEIKLDALTVGHFTHNDRSRRVIEKCGFRYIKNRPYFAKQLAQTYDECFYRLTREEWLSAQKGADDSWH